jgi:hypothetical protein
MVLSSISPLFVIWAIRGSHLIGDRWLVSACALLILLPNGFLWIRLRTAERLKDRRELVIGHVEDHRDHLLVYLFAMLVPFYADEMAHWRTLISTLVTVAFIVFLFWHLNLHYMNLLFAVKGYRVFTVNPPAEANGVSGKTSFVLITRRVSLVKGERLPAYRLSDTVYIEKQE